MRDWQDRKIQRFKLNDGVGSQVPDRTAELIYILENITAIQNAEYSTMEILTKIGEDVCDESILDSLENSFQRRVQENLEQADSHVFAADELNTTT